MIRERWDQHFHELVQGQVTLAKIMGYDDERLMKLAGKGLRLLTIGKLPAALKVFRALVILDPWIPYFHYLLGSAYEKLGDLERAWREYSGAIGLTEGMDPVPDVVPFALLGQGRMLLRKGELESALAVLWPVAEGRFAGAEPKVLAVASLICRHLEEQLAGRT